MEKLFELLQIYVIERQWREQFKLHWDKIILRRPYKLRRFPQYDTNAVIISKRFWFIQWLIENDELDLWSNTFTEKEEHYFWEQPDFTFQSVKYTHLLMLLSVSESPIEFLISILR